MTQGRKAVSKNLLGSTKNHEELVIHPLLALYLSATQEEENEKARKTIRKQISV